MATTNNETDRGDEAGQSPSTFAQPSPTATMQGPESTGSASPTATMAGVVSTGSAPHTTTMQDGSSRDDAVARPAEPSTVPAPSLEHPTHVIPARKATPMTDQTLYVAKSNNPVTDWISDTITLTVRNLIRLKRNPFIFVFALAQPIMFVLLFSQIYGGAIKVAGSNYTSFIMAGIFMQSVLFGSMHSGQVMATELSEGMVERLRALPINATAVLFSRALADVVLNFTTLVVMMAAGAMVGWRPEGTVLQFFGGVCLIMLVSFSLSWLAISLGLVVPRESLMGASMLILFPATFISNAFVPTSTMPETLGWIANHNPISAFVQASRELFGNVGTMPLPDVWTMQNAVLFSVLSAIVILIVGMAWATTVFNRKRK